jgi:hypothetical protein
VSAYLALVKADIDLMVRGINRVVAALPACSYRQASPSDLESMRTIARAVKSVALYYRPGARCLPQAVAIARLLRRRDFPVTLVVAVRRLPFAAHAWVECDGQVLTDRQTVRSEYAPLMRAEPSGSSNQLRSGRDAQEIAR